MHQTQQRKTYRIDDLEQLQDHMLSALHRAWLKNLQNRQQSVGADDQVLDLAVLPQ